MMVEPLNPMGDGNSNCRGRGIERNANVGFVGGNDTTSYVSGPKNISEYSSIVGGKGFKCLNGNSLSSVSIENTVLSDSSNETFDESMHIEFDFDMSRDRRYPIGILHDCNGGWHSAMKLKCTVSHRLTTKGKKYVNPRQCEKCGKLSRVKCYQCDKVFCYPLKDKTNISSCCFYKHVHGKKKCLKKHRRDNK